MIGMAAIPIGEINAIGNVGNITTCSIQGFVIYVCSMTALFYYCSFSIYSFVGILNNFDFTRNKNKIGWIEKYIHVLVHIYPIGSALYLLSKQSFNAHTYGFCFIGSAPMGCVYDDDDIPCERGPTTYDELKQFYLLFWMGPLVVQLIFPTTVMVLLYYMIKQRQDKIFMNAAIFRKQAVRKGEENVFIVNESNRINKYSNYVSYVLINILSHVMILTNLCKFFLYRTASSQFINLCAMPDDLFIRSVLDHTTFPCRSSIGFNSTQ